MVKSEVYIPNKNFIFLVGLGIVLLSAAKDNKHLYNSNTPTITQQCAVREQLRKLLGGNCLTTLQAFHLHGLGIRAHLILSDYPVDMV